MAKAVLFLTGHVGGLINGKAVDKVTLFSFPDEYADTAEAESVSLKIPGADPAHGIIVDVSESKSFFFENFGAEAEVQLEHDDGTPFVPAAPTT